MRSGGPSVDRIVVFGEVLFDRFPDGTEVLGGAPFNVAWNLQALGARPVLVSRVGADARGERILEAMGSWGMSTAGVQVDALRPTGTVEVRFENGEPGFDIVADRAYDHILEEMVPDLAQASLLYHGSLVCRSDRSRRTLNGLIRRCAPAVFFDVNLRAPWCERDVVLRLLESAREVKMNENELAELAPGHAAEETRALELLSRYGIERLFVTRGARGAAAFSSAGERSVVEPPGGVRVEDTVGAGDAFASVLILGRVQSWSLGATLERAQEFAAAVVGLQGATSSAERFYRGFREAWRGE